MIAGHAAHSVTGRYAGGASRAVAALIDLLVLIGVYTGGVWLIDFLLDVLLGISDPDVPNIVATLALFGWAGAYLTLCTAISGRTVGKGLVGLKIVTREGRPVGPLAALLRVLVFPISTAIFGIGLLLIVLRRDRRALHDLIAHTCVVYDWGDRPAELPGPLAAYIASRGASA